MTRILSKSWSLWLVAAILLVPVTTVLQGCTDLDEETFGVITPDQFFQTDEEIIAALAPVYAQLRSMMWAYHNISQVSSDEALVPVRGTDWDDGGAWRELHVHTWTAANGDFNSAWTDAYTGVARANVVLANLPDGSDPSIAAELRFLRAFYYYQLMDLFGGVPVVTDAVVDQDNPPSRESRAAVFSFIESELNEARTDLPTSWDGANQGRATQGAADALLAKIYLNAEVFTGTVSGSGLARGTARWADAITAADRVLNSGQYQLTGDQRDNFRAGNHTSPEIIFSVGHLGKGGLGLTFIMRGLHYNQIPQTPWNGFSTLAETYNRFDEDDQRRNIFLVGQQFAEPNQGCLGNECFTTGAALEDRVGNPLSFTLDYFDPSGNPVTDVAVNLNETSGARVMKWEIDSGRVGGDNGNDYAFFRLAEMYLIKAEAMNEMGQTAGAMAIVNQLRARVFDPDEPVAATSQADAREAIWSERQFELFWEATRRQDLIRAGKFTDAWEFKPAGGGHLVLGPIPQVQIDSNPNLTQNAGY